MPAKKISIDGYQEITAQTKKIKVCLEFIGEGLSGDWNPDDKHDIPLVRFSVYGKVGKEWEPIDDASYCTQLRADLPMRTLRKAAKLILNRIGDNTKWIKRLCEELSWIDDSWIKG